MAIATGRKQVFQMQNSLKSIRYSYSIVEDNLESRIRNGLLPVDVRIPSENELSRKYKISRMSARQAITNLVARNLLYRIAGKGTFVADWKDSTQSSIIGLVLNNVANPFFAQLTKTIQKKAAESGYDVICYANNHLLEESRAIDMLINRGIAGVVLVPSQDSGEENLVGKLDNKKIPFVYLNRILKKPEADFVISNNADGAKQAMEYLFSLGHTRIGFVAAFPYTSAVSERIDGYNSFMKKRNLSERPAVQISSCLNDKGGYDAGNTILSSPRRPTAIFCANDITAVGVMKAARELRINVPEELSIVGYDDIELAGHLSPPLTTISQQLEQMAESAIDILMTKIRGKHTGEITKMVLHPKLVVRESCGIIQEKENNAGVDLDREGRKVEHVTDA
ncbi:MAG: GntR family transcriptional regulator [Verrucomicrobia bacterium]|nr:GntR family transcriptional regulator [Verrucomicrobiota bacterium]MBU4428345.1 GntR family transcriptional regulator [Verrucomicrobiota bacterium]